MFLKITLAVLSSVGCCGLAEHLWHPGIDSAVGCVLSLTSWRETHVCTYRVELNLCLRLFNSYNTLNNKHHVLTFNAILWCFDPSSAVWWVNPLLDEKYCQLMSASSQKKHTSRTIKLIWQWPNENNMCWGDFILWLV